MANPLDPTFSPLTTRTAAPPLPTAEDYAMQIRAAGLTPRQGFVEEPEMPSVRMARLAYSPSQKKFFVGGYTFDDDNDTAAVTFSKYANQEAPLPEGDWQEIDPASYAQYVENIRSPGFFQQIANNFDIGLDEMQQTLGYGLMFAGAEETGRWLADQQSDLAKTAVYQRSIENIGENGVLDWIAATIGRFGPNILESVGMAAVGGIAGSTLLPGAGTTGGAVLGFFGKSAVKKAVYEAAKKHFKGQALDAAEKKLLLSAAGMVNAASNAAKTRLAPGAFNEFMQEGLQTGAEAVARRVAARAPMEIGAVGLSTASNIFQQTGQAYGETMAGGGPGDRAVALGVGTIGGLADTAGEFLLAGRVFSEAMGDVAGSVTKRQKALNLLKRVGAGAGVGAGMEGTTETFQEALQIAANPVVNIGTPEGQSRLLNALAGGALLGGGFGGAGGIFAGSLADDKQETDLLLPLSSNDPNYAQYREDVKRQLGEAEYNKIFEVPRVYRNVGPSGAEFAAARGIVPPSAMQPQGELFATSPMGVSFRPPVAPQEVAPAPAVGQGEFPFVPQARFPVPAVPANIPSPAEMVGPIVPSGTQASLPFEGAGQAPAPVPTGPLLPPSTDMGGTQLGLFQTYAPPAAATPQGELLLRGGRGQAPARVPTGPMPQQPTDLGGVQGALQPRKEPPPPAPPTNQMTEQLARLRRGMEFEQARQQAAATRVTPAERAYTEATIGQSITLDTEGASTGTNKLQDDGRRRIIAGFNALTKPQQDAILVEFNNDETQLLDYVRREKPPVVRKQFAALAGVDVKAFEVKTPKPAEPQAAAQPIKEETNATQPGAGTGSAAPAGKRAGKDRGAGKGDNLRKGAATTREEPAPEAQGSAAGSEQAQAEETVPPAVKPLRKPLKKEPQPPKAPEVAATSAKTAAELRAEEKARKAEEKARKAEEAARVKAEKKAQREREEAEREANKYENLSEEQQIALAKEGALAGGKIATLMEREQDVPSLPLTATKEERDLFEVHGTIGNIIFAQRENRREGVKVSVKDEAKRTFVSNVAILLRWASDTGMEPKARNMARAYLESEITADETAPLKKGVQQAIDDAKQGMFMLSTFDLVENPIDENGRPAKGVNPIRVKAIVDKFRSGLAKAPQFYVYKNQADLQRRNPALYQQAVGSRPQGDFDTARASGFAFDGKVLVFTDRIPTEKYMRLLLAHESIGHFGMRALLPASKFDALMDYVYENNMAVRRAADSKLAGSTDLGARREAVEEYMAKYAEKLDSSVIARVWNAIKDVLNKLGIKFEDDIVRYLVSQARRTVREGSSLFTPSTFALNVHTITTNNGTGRFSTEPIYTAQHELSNAFYLAAPPPYNLDTARKTFKDYKIDSADKLENFLRNVFRLRNFNALRNHGAQRFEYLKDAMRVAAQSLRNVYNEKLAGLLALSGQSRHVVSYALVVSRRIADRRFMLDKELRTSELIVLGNEQPDGTRALDINKPIFERLLKMGTLSRDELNNGAEVTYEEPAEGGKTVKTTVKIPGVKEKFGRDLTDNEYNIYVKTRRDLAELDVERLKGQLQNFIATSEITTKGIRKVLADKNMTDADVAFVKSIVNHAKKLHLDDIEYDERGMPTLTPKAATRMEQYFAAINNAVVKREFTDDLKAEVRKFYLPKQGRDKDGKVKKPSAEALAEGNKKSEAAIKKIEEFRSRRTEFTGREEQSVIYTLQDRIKEIVLADAAFEKAQMSARRSIGSSHVPLWREGSWQVRVEAQINGRAVKLHPEVQNKLLFSLHTQRSESENAAAEFNDGMKDLEYNGLVYNEENGEYKTQTFKLFAVPSKVVESVASEPSIDIDNFLYTLRVLGQPLAPDKHAKAITMLTAPGSALRKALRFDDSPGYDPLKSVEAVARHVTTRSSLIARTKFQPHMRDLMDLSTDTGKLWFGDAEAVMTAKENLDKATDDRAKAYWQDKLTTDLYKYVTTNPGAKGWDGSRAKFPGQPKQASLGMRDYSDSIKEMEWMQDSSNINESTFEGKQLAAGMKMITSVGFLGGMLTQFAQNLMSPATNVLPYLASKDSQTGFGGGFGVAVIPTYTKAFKDVVGWRGLNPFSDPIKDAEAFEQVANTIKAARDIKDTAKEAELVQQYGLSYYEALNIAREIREGKLIPAQANALLETARGMFTGPISKGFLKFSDVYMSPFNVSEQATRRATFLTAFRLEFDRLKQAGFNEDKASEMARIFAVDTVDKTLGEYSNTNRPPVWRDGWQSLLFVYKTYPLTSLLLFKNMSRAGKIGMLTSLYVLAGAAGFPLVDDMEDFIDTLSQRLGLDLGQGPSIRMAIIRQLEEIFPGWSDMILRGPMNHFTGADVGAKFGLEDFIPGTGILLKGANTTEELKSIAGPVFGMTLSIGKFAYDFGRAPLSSTVSTVDVAREAPFSLVRAAGDVAAYMQNGAIVDRRGYVVTPEVNAMTMLARLAGFYPAEAAKQYDFIKYANRMNYDYKEVGTAYKLAWVKAKMTGDERQAARIVREVNDWNEANRGGPGVIRNFLKNAQRALKEARRPAGERFLKSAPVASRASYDRFLEYITGE